MNLTLTRTSLGRTSLLGQLIGLAVNGKMYTLERRSDDPLYRCIPAGTYPVTVEPTHNPRLWTPTPDRRLPHLWQVPERTGIEIHAGNTSKDTEGCVVVGFSFGADNIGRSRDAVITLIAALDAAPGPHTITVSGLGT